VAEPGLDDVFCDDITVPATDGYPLAATLFLPRGAKRHVVLINSATAVPRRLYRGFAGYLAKRGCAVLTYDYRGIGDSRQQALTGYNRKKSLVGFKASMSDWAAQDIAATVAWMRERYKALPSPMSDIRSAARRSACCRTIRRFRARCSSRPKPATGS
jgi:predicted alpha/beta hydrolase